MPKDGAGGTGSRDATGKGLSTRRSGKDKGKGKKGGKNARKLGKGKGGFRPPPAPEGDITAQSTSNLVARAASLDRYCDIIKTWGVKETTIEGFRQEAAELRQQAYKEQTPAQAKIGIGAAVERKKEQMRKAGIRITEQEAIITKAEKALADERKAQSERAKKLAQLEEAYKQAEAAYEANLAKGTEQQKPKESAAEPVSKVRDFSKEGVLRGLIQLLPDGTLFDWSSCQSFFEQLAAAAAAQDKRNIDARTDATMGAPTPDDDEEDEMLEELISKDGVVEQEHVDAYVARHRLPAGTKRAAIEDLIHAAVEAKKMRAEKVQQEPNVPAGEAATQSQPHGAGQGKEHAAEVPAEADSRARSRSGNRPPRGM